MVRRGVEVPGLRADRLRRAADPADRRRRRCARARSARRRGRRRARPAARWACARRPCGRPPPGSAPAAPAARSPGRPARASTVPAQTEALAAEPAADVRGDHPHALDRHVEPPREVPAHPVDRSASTSWTVSRSPSQTAVVACGSSALWFCGGVVNRRSTDTGAAGQRRLRVALAALAGHHRHGSHRLRRAPCAAREVGDGGQPPRTSTRTSRAACVRRLEGLRDDDRDRLAVPVHLVGVQVVHRGPGRHRAEVEQVQPGAAGTSAAARSGG